MKYYQKPHHHRAKVELPSERLMMFNSTKSFKQIRTKIGVGISSNKYSRWKFCAWSVSWPGGAPSVLPSGAKLSPRLPPSASAQKVTNIRSWNKGAKAQVS